MLLNLGPTVSLGEAHLEILNKTPSAKTLFPRVPFTGSRAGSQTYSLGQHDFTHHGDLGLLALVSSS